MVCCAGALVSALSITAVVLQSPALAHAPTGDRDFAIAHYRQMPTYSIRATPLRVPRGHRESAVTAVVVGLGYLIAILVLVGLLAATVAVLRSWWQRRPRRQNGAGLVADPVPLVHRGLEEARRRLDFGAPDDAIVACWVALEQAAARSGVEPDPADTPSELVIRILDSMNVDTASLQELSQLYHRARFGLDPTTDDDRESARRSLERVAASLDARVSVP